MGQLAIENKQVIEKQSHQQLNKPVKENKPAINFVDESDKNIMSAINKSKLLVDDSIYSVIRKADYNSDTNRAIDIGNVSSSDIDSDSPSEHKFNEPSQPPRLPDKKLDAEAEKIIKLSSSSSSLSTNDEQARDTNKQKTSSNTNLCIFDDLLDIDFNMLPQQKTTVESLIANSFNLIDKAAPPAAGQPPLSALITPTLNPTLPTQVPHADLISDIENLNFHQKLALFQSNLSSSSTHSSLNVASTPNSAFNPLKTIESEKKPAVDTHKSILNEFDPFSDQSIFGDLSKKAEQPPQVNKRITSSQTMQAISNRNGMIAPPVPQRPSQPTFQSASFQSTPRPNYNINLPTATQTMNQNSNVLPASNQVQTNQAFFNHFSPTPFQPSMTHPNLSSVYKPVQFNYGSAVSNHQLQQQHMQQPTGSQFLASALFSAETSLSSVVTANTIISHQQNQHDTFNPNDLL
jgi:hypothetical protein